jgi:hypothetical protein
MTSTLLVQSTHDILPEADDPSRTAEWHKLDGAGLAWLKPDSGSSGNIEPHAACSYSVKVQRRVGFSEVIMAANLDRPVAGVRYIKAERF